MRSDIRAGNDVRLADQGPLVVTTSSGDQLRYELGPEGCRRTSITPDAIEIQTDLFVIGEATTWNLEQMASGRLPLVAVTLEQPVHKNDLNSPKRLPFVVYAAVVADGVDEEARTN